METYISTLLCIIFYLFFCKILQQKLKANVVFQRLRLCSQYQLFVTAKSNCCEQVVSNDELQSVEHRVVIKSTQEAGCPSASSSILPSVTSPTSLGLSQNW
jgi:hypothetical protein